MNGLLVVDKPVGPSSRAAVDPIQRLLPRGTKIGHTGTLDPRASGVLVLCLGLATRLAEYVQDMDKEYTTTLYLGITSTSADADGELTPTPNAVLPDRITLTAALPAFVGRIEQVPPAFSAAKVEGRRAYDLARRGQAVELAARTVQIYALTLVEYAPPLVRLHVHCGKGTYIRALARDLGARLGCGAYVTELRRTRVGPFMAAQAGPEPTDLATLAPRLLPTEQALAALPVVAVSAEQAVRLRMGQALPPVPNVTGLVRLVALGDLVGVGQASERALRPEKILPAEPGA
jgi:tRNA pseudouridine55 synthase